MDTDPMSGVARIAQPSVANIAAVRTLAPLSTDLMIRCGPFDVPAALVASSTTLEQEDSEEGQIARDFVEEDPWHGMGSVHSGGWMLLARDDDTVVIGQREGLVGMGAVVEFEHRADGFKARTMGGWRLQPRDASEQVEACFTARTRGTAITVDWMNGQDLDDVPERIHPRVELLEGPDDVHFLLHSAPNEPRLSRNGWAVGTGRSETTSFELRAPLGGRRLLSDQRIPPVSVTVTTTG